jgi:hypothetical protein
METGGSLLVLWRATGKIDPRSRLLLAGLLLVLAAVWIPLFLLRIHAHQANVDDFEYAALTRNLIRAPNPISAVLHTGQTSPLVLLLAAPGVDLFGVYGGIFVDLPLLLLLAVGAFILARRWLSPFGATLTALGAGLNAAVLAYAVMLNFALASTTAVVWCFAAYVRCERFSNWRWSITFGIAFAALILSRSMAPVYAAPLVLLVVIDAVAGARRSGGLPRWPALGAAATVLVLAGPWWAFSGPAAWHYLTYAGYQSSSGFTNTGLIVTPAAVVDRARYELETLGGAESAVLALLVVAALCQVVRDRRARQLQQLWILPVWVVAALLILSSSSNLGTAFGLPLIVVTVVACAVVLGRTIDVGSRLLPALLVALLCAGAISQFTSSMNSWWHGPPYRQQVLEAGGSTRTNVDAVTASVAHDLPRGKVDSAMDAPIINNNGLVWYAPTDTRIVSPDGSDATRMAISLLASSRSLITGTTRASFFPLDPFSVDRAAYRLGYRPVRSWTVSKIVKVELWVRGAKGPSVVFPAVVRVAKPHDGSTLTGDTFLVADASDPLGISHVAFEIRGSALVRPVTVEATRFVYGWLGAFNSNELPNGTYTITGLAKNAIGETSPSKPVTVEVEKK